MAQNNNLVPVDVGVEIPVTCNWAHVDLPLFARTLRSGAKRLGQNLRFTQRKAPIWLALKAQCRQCAKNVVSTHDKIEAFRHHHSPRAELVSASDYNGVIFSSPVNWAPFLNKTSVLSGERRCATTTYVPAATSDLVRDECATRCPA